jgi:Putative MetA-pathway of phenol degradation
MATKRHHVGRFVPLLALALFPVAAQCGAPFQTDDPAVVPAGRIDVLTFYQSTLAGTARTGSAPGVELHWGMTDTAELDVASSLAFSATPDAATRRGYGDTSLAVKYRLVDEADDVPLISLVPKLTLATANAERSLGNGGSRFLLGAAMQKGRGPVQTYANVAYSINNGAGNRNFWFVGWQAQRQLSSHWIVGAEVFGATAQATGERASSGFNVGGYHLFDRRNQMLFSIGRGLSNVHDTNRVSAYVGYQASF